MNRIYRMNFCFTEYLRSYTFDFGTFVQFVKKVYDSTVLSKFWLDRADFMAGLFAPKADKRLRRYLSHSERNALFHSLELKAIRPSG